MTDSINTSARDNILARLRANPAPRAPINVSAPPVPERDREAKIQRFTELMTAVRTEVVRLGAQSWVDWVTNELPRRGLKSIVVGDNENGDALESAAGDNLNITRYTQSIEAWKSSLFADIDVGITGTLGGIAETGSLVLWPDATEPRLMSLAPPVHIALLEADKLINTFAETVESLDWADGMPTNALLISGPSKTADIEQTLAYGIHGPRELIVLIRD